jgi:hypothetical protein
VSRILLLAVTLLCLGACTRIAPDTATAGVAAPSGTAAPALARWAPSLGLHWQIQLGGVVNQTIAATYYDLDPFSTSQETVRALNAAGRRTICHLDVGVSDSALPDAAMLPASIIGISAGNDERWLDIRAWGRLEPVLRNRLELCHTKGFQGVDADMAYGYAYHSGFDLTEAEQLAFDLDVAALAHKIGLEVAVRATPALAADLVGATDFAVVDGCVTAATCADYRPYVEGGKAVLDLETGPAIDFCPLALYDRFAALAKPDGVAAPRVTFC